MVGSLIAIILIALFMFAIHRGHGSMGGCGRHAHHHHHPQKEPFEVNREAQKEGSESHHHQ